MGLVATAPVRWLPSFERLHILSFTEPLAGLPGRAKRGPSAPPPYHACSQGVTPDSPRETDMPPAPKEQQESSHTIAAKPEMRIWQSICSEESWA